MTPANRLVRDSRSVFPIANTMIEAPRGRSGV